MALSTTMLQSAIAFASPILKAHCRLVTLWQPYMQTEAGVHAMVLA